MKTFCFKLYKSNRNIALMKQINTAGLIYNHCIALHKRYYRLYSKTLNVYQLKRHLTKLKRTQRFAYMRELGSQAVQDIAERIDRAYKLFWENLKIKIKCSPPKFKKICRYKSFTLRQSGWKLDELHGKIKIMGKWFGYFQSRMIEGRVKTVTVKRDNVGDIYVYLACDNQCGQVKPRAGQIAGFDFGLKRFLTSSDGNDIESPDFFKQNAKNIKNKSRKLYRKAKDSHNRMRARKDLARAYRKLENQRKDFHYKLARKLCEKYACICLETLNIKAMGKLWGRKIYNLGFYSFVKILQYEASKFGTQVVFIPMFYPSSQLCHVCGYKNEEVRNLRVREWECPNCKTKHDRDRNAAINIYRAGASTLRGDAVRPEQSGGVVDTKISRF